MKELTDPLWQTAGNVLLVLMTLSYITTLVLLLILRPRDIMEWATTAKVAGVLAVFLNGCLVVFFGIGTAQPLRVIVFGLATAGCWFFTVVAWRDWMTRRERT
jgi:hypothetical protein